MKTGEVIEYLKTFPEDTDLRFLLANPRERKLYECVNIFGVTDSEYPLFCIDVGKAIDMDAELVAICEEDERKAEILAKQMDVTDFPEVLK